MYTNKWVGERIKRLPTFLRMYIICIDRWNQCGSSVPRLDLGHLRIMPGKYTVSIKRRRFYDSVIWKRAKQEKIMMARGICERCGRKGTEVHHKIPLTDDNIDDPNISINPDNLELLCKSCHDQARCDEEGTNPNRIEFTENGDVIIKRRYGG